jgi:hypothetical protein
MGLLFGSSQTGAAGPGVGSDSSSPGALNSGSSLAEGSRPVRPLCQPVFSRSKTSGWSRGCSAGASSSSPSSACLARTRASQSGTSAFALGGASGSGAGGAARPSSASHAGSSPSGGPASSDDASRSRLSQSGPSPARPAGRAGGFGSPSGSVAAVPDSPLSHSPFDQSGSVERRRASQSPSSAPSAGGSSRGASSSGARSLDSQSGIGGSPCSGGGVAAPPGRTGVRRAPQKPHSSAPSGLALLHIGHRTSATAQSP